MLRRITSSTGSEDFGTCCEEEHGSCTNVQYKRFSLTEPKAMGIRRFEKPSQSVMYPNTDNAKDLSTALSPSQGLMIRNNWSQQKMTYGTCVWTYGTFHLKR